MRQWLQATRNRAGGVVDDKRCDETTCLETERVSRRRALGGIWAVSEDLSSNGKVEQDWCWLLIR